jgi:hypothetical protein
MIKSYGYFGGFEVFSGSEKQSQFAGLCLEILSTKLKILNGLKGCYLKKQTQFVGLRPEIRISKL